MTKIDLTEILEILKKQEPIFHQPELGTTRTAFENMTVEDFWEVGASGQRYDRQEVIETCTLRYQDKDYIQNDVWSATNFECREIASDSYLLTYILIQGKEQRQTRRSTIWQWVNDEWKIFYHQGTIIQSHTPVST